MIKILATFQMREKTQPNEAVINRFRDVVEDGIISCEMVSRLTGINEEYLKNYYQESVKYMIRKRLLL